MLSLELREKYGGASGGPLPECANTSLPGQKARAVLMIKQSRKGFKQKRGMSLVAT